MDNHTSYIEYVVEMNVHLSDKIHIDHNKDNIKLIEIEKIESKPLLNVKIFFHNDDMNYKEAENLTSHIVLDIINLLSYQFDIPYKDYYPSIFYNKGKTVKYGQAVFTTVSTMQVMGDNTIPFKADFKKKELLIELRENPHHLMLRTILTIENILTKYILLYSLLYSIKGDKQGNVEDFIKQHEPNVKYKKRKRSTGEVEERTIYTTLRNRVMHMAKGEDISEVTKEMSRTINGLLKHVKTAIEKNHSFDK